MIGLLAIRTLSDRPRRTLLLLLGFGISVGVMITLLSIGDAVLEQARDKDLVGGGDLVLLPVGMDVEVMKVGGATGMYYTIENARFVYRQVLSGPRLVHWLAPVSVPSADTTRPPLAAASPVLADKVVYVQAHGSLQNPMRALATGVLPTLERVVRGPLHGPDGHPVVWPDTPADLAWMDPPLDSLYNQMDRFHVPPAPGRDDWAEWLYFNFMVPKTGTHGYLSFIVSGDLLSDAGRATPVLQIVSPGHEPLRFDAEYPMTLEDVSTQHVDVRIGPGTRVVFRDGAYRLDLDWESEAGPVRGHLIVRPLPDLYYPPFLIHSGQELVSGYTVPILRGRMHGHVTVGTRRLDLENAVSYHDHNWGTWKDVHWDWGTASTAEYALLYGRVEHPDIRPGHSGSGLFVVLSQARKPGQRGGLLALFRPRGIDYTWDESKNDNTTAVPRTIHIQAIQEPSVAGSIDSKRDRIDVRFEVEDHIPTMPREGQRALVFQQLWGRYKVQAQVGGRNIFFETMGFAEAFTKTSAPDAP